jgi:hypothetical protein
MIVVRDIFQLHFGKAREAIALAKEMRVIEQAAGYPVARILTDVVGEYYTLVMESTFENLAQHETGLRQGTQDPRWRELYATFVPLVRSGRREVFRVVED